MLALMSFTLLGIWTVILSFINNTDRFETLIPESRIASQRQSKYPEDQQKKMIFAQTENSIAPSNAPSKPFEAFKNLWKEIIYGV